MSQDWIRFRRECSNQTTGKLAAAKWKRRRMSKTINFGPSDPSGKVESGMKGQDKGTITRRHTAQPCALA